MTLKLVLAFLLLPVLASAQTATIIIAERRGTDRAHFVAEFADKSQLDIDVPLPDANETAIRTFINAKRAPAPLLAKGTVIDLSVVPPPPPVDPPADPAVVAFKVWHAKAQRLQSLKALGLTHPDAAKDLSDLEADVNATYLQGYATQF